MNSLSTSSSVSWSKVSVVYVVCSCVVGWVVVVVVMVVKGRVGCSSLLLTKSLSMDSHFEPSCAVVSRVGVGGLLCFQYTLCLVDTAGFQLEMSCVQRPSWCLAIILACFQNVLLCLKIHDVIPYSCQQVVRFARCSRHVVDPWFQLVFWIAF